jgi:hypothetical protein
MPLFGGRSAALRIEPCFTVSTKGRCRYRKRRSKVSVSLAPKFNVGDTFYVASTDRERRKLDCPDCLGEKVFRVVAPSGDEFTLDCPRCSGNTWVRDVPSLEYDHHIPKVRSDVIVGYCVNEWGEQGIQYRGKSHTVKESALVTDEAIALKNAETLAASLNAKDAADPVRIHHKALGSLKLKEAVLETFKSGLYDSWSAFRYLREGVDEIIENESRDYGDRESIVSSLEDRLSQTQRYEFVFKGFTRAMEAVVALVNADADKEAEILTALREHWSKLPEQAQEAWQPSERIAHDWSGKPCPTY